MPFCLACCLILCLASHHDSIIQAGRAALGCERYHSINNATYVLNTAISFTMAKQHLLRNWMLPENGPDTLKNSTETGWSTTTADLQAETCRVTS